MGDRPRINLPIFARLASALRQRDWFGIGFELFVVVLGVLLGLQASRWSADREDRRYHAQMVTALDETLKVYVEAGEGIHREISGIILAYERQLKAGEKPPPPYWRLDKLERPPTLAWEAMVATGIARSLEPKLVFEIARFFSRGDGLGDRYQRYNAFTEGQVLPFLANPAHFYAADGRLRGEYRAHLDRLRELLAVNDDLTEEARYVRKRLAEGA